MPNKHFEVTHQIRQDVEYALTMSRTVTYGAHSDCKVPPQHSFGWDPMVEAPDGTKIILHRAVAAVYEGGTFPQFRNDTDHVCKNPTCDREGY